MLNKLKNDIILVEHKYDEQVKLNNTYREEIETLRNNTKEHKSKEILENEKILKLEITNLNNTINFKIQENDLLKKENEILNDQLNRFEKMISELSNKEISIPDPVKHEERAAEVQHPSPKKITHPVNKSENAEEIRKEEPIVHVEKNNESHSDVHKPPKKAEVHTPNVVDEPVSEVDKLIAPPKVFNYII